jgi:hypothetical protein
MTKINKATARVNTAKKGAAKPPVAGNVASEPKSASVRRVPKYAASSKAAASRPKAGATASPHAATDKAAIVVATAPTKPKTTKQEQVLTMLSQKGGVTIDEIMKATGWQQHSVRGFFAGTVRKRLGFELTSKKGDGDDRRYAIKVAA